MKITPEIIMNLKQEIHISQSEIDKAQERLSSWTGSARQIELITKIINQHWPRIAFIKVLLGKQFIGEEDLKVIKRGTLTELEFKNLKRSNN